MADSGSSSGGVTSKLWEFFTKTGSWFDINLYETIHYRKRFKLNSINFLPLYVEQHTQNDFYTKMFSQLYPDPPTRGLKDGEDPTALEQIGSAISSAAGAAVNKVANTVANQITSTANYAKSLVSTLTFGLVDTSQKVTAGCNSSFGIVRDNIPRLRVTEIRLNDKLTQKGILFSCLGKMFQAGSSLAKGSDGMKNVGEKIATAFESGLNAVTDKILHMSASDWLSKMSSGSVRDALTTRIGGIAYSFIKDVASGEYMNTYDLPHFVNNPTMLSSIGADGFDKPAPSKNPILKMINDMTGGNLAFQENISWHAGGNMTQGPFTGTFYLFNDTLMMYAHNLDLVVRLVTHSMAIRDTFMYRPPCCYDVTDVGCRRCYFCSGEFTIKKVGKIRLLKSDYNSATNVEYVDKLLAGIKNRVAKLTTPSSAVNVDFLNYVPDAFEISYTFTPLISENFNTFIYYFLQKHGAPSTAVLPSRKLTTNDRVGDYYGCKTDFLKDDAMKTFVDAFSESISKSSGGNP